MNAVLRKRDAETEKRRSELERKARNFTATGRELLELFWINNP